MSFRVVWLVCVDILRGVVYYLVMAERISGDDVAVLLAATLRECAAAGVWGTVSFHVEFRAGDVYQASVVRQETFRDRDALLGGGLAASRLSNPEV